MNEIWKVYKKTQRSIWEISSFGNVRLNSKYYALKTDGNGRMIAGKWRVHRMVAETFIPNPLNKPCVDHVDTNPRNNNVNNLRWVTYSENNNNPLTLKHMSVSHIGQESKRKKPVLMYTKTGEFVKEFESIAAAAQITSTRHISCVCNGKRSSAGGFVWKYKENTDKNTENIKKNDE